MIDAPIPPRCERCHYWDGRDAAMYEADVGIVLGSCCRYPARVNTRPEDWCGEFVAAGSGFPSMPSLFPPAQQAQS